MKQYPCPICNNLDYIIEGDWLEYTQVDPDHCEFCGWCQSNGTKPYEDWNKFVRYCWELQIAPCDLLRK